MQALTEYPAIEPALPRALSGVSLQCDTFSARVNEGYTRWSSRGMRSSVSGGECSFLRRLALVPPVVSAFR